MNTRLQAITSAGRTLSFDLPTDQVFEDLAPRLVKLNEISVPPASAGSDCQSTA